MASFVFNGSSVCRETHFSDTDNAFTARKNSSCFKTYQTRGPSKFDHERSKQAEGNVSHDPSSRDHQKGWCEFLEGSWKSGVWVDPRNSDDAVYLPVTAADTESHMQEAGITEVLPENF